MLKSWIESGVRGAEQGREGVSRRSKRKIEGWGAPSGEVAGDGATFALLPNDAKGNGACLCSPSAVVKMKRTESVGK